MAKCNIHGSYLILQIILFLQIIIPSQTNFLEGVTLNNYNSSGSRPRCVEAEGKALLKFKTGLTDPSGRFSSWVGEDCCGWVGVGCSNRTGNVVKLDLQGDSYKESSMLRGKLSPSLIELKYLNYLNLSRNKFDGMVPPQLGNLTNLRYLDLSYNSLWSSELNWLSSLTCLKYLSLGSVNLSKAESTGWLKAVSLLPSLSELHLRSCNLEHPPPPPPPLSLSIANLTSLSVIDLSHNQLISEVPSWLFNLTNLMQLVLSTCNITSSISHLPWHDLHNLEVLNLGSNSISDDIGLFIDALSERSNISLQRLDLSSNHFSGQLGESLGGLTSLTSLCLKYNSISGEIPPSIGMLSFLEELQLSSNKMNGSIPESVGDLSLLNLLGLADNDWNGRLSQVLFKNLNKLKTLSVSCSEDSVFDVPHEWTPPFSLESIYITDCQLGPAFPPWVQTQTELGSIVLSNAQISDTIPDWFWNLYTPQVWWLDFSSNRIGGVLPSLLQFNPTRYGYMWVDLSHNQLRGPVPLWTNVTNLYLNNNLFSGPIPTEIGTIMSSLKYLHLSLNFLNGTIPKSISKMGNLIALDLSKNNLSGEMLDTLDILTQLGYLDLSKNGLFGEFPMSICALTNLFWLDLSDNSLDGRLPLSLQNCTSLEGLNLGGNKFSGNIPRWLGKSLNLSMLSLRMNKLSGEIPQELCYHPKLHALDLSHNNLSSTIPACFGSLSRLIVLDTYTNDLSSGREAMGFFVKGRLLGFVFSNLYLLNVIDLSNNNLAGAIPDEITNLIGLGTLNLSRNHLSRKLPEKIGELKLLETLDLSHNQLTGPIPTSMASLTFLSSLDLSFNDLAGRIPSSSQISTFNNSIYEGNTGLCGRPLPTSCYSAVNEDPGKGRGHKGKGGSKFFDGELFLFLVSLGLGFIAGFWVFVATLAIKRSWRIAYFEYFERVNDRIFVFVAMNIDRLKRTIERN